MSEFTLFRTLAIYLPYLFFTVVSGCAIFEKNPATDTSSAVEKTAYSLCGGCHGPANVRVGFMTPNIIGQKKGYLATTLRDYRNKKRIEPLMNGIAKSLSDQDIDNIAAYFSSYEQNKK